MAVYLKNGTIADGTGAELYNSGILIEGERIAAITAVKPEIVGLEVIDCTGKLVTPGFIDAHSHNDWYALGNDRREFFEPFIRQGITTFVTGNCGFSATGYSENTPYLSDIGGGLFDLDEESKKSPSFRSWLDAVRQKAPANIASLIGHGTTRIGVNGKGAEQLTKERCDAMMTELERSLQDGALGISLGLMYEPGIFAPKEELLDVARLVKKYNRILTVHAKAESAVSLSYPLTTGSHLMLALNELADIVRETGVRFEYSHLLFIGRRSWPDEDKAIQVFKNLKAEGFDVGFDMYPLDYGASVITVVLPEWFMKMTPEDRKKPFTRFKLWAMISVTVKLLGFGFPDIRITYAGENHTDMIGKTIPELAKEWGISNFKAYLRVCEESEYRARVLQSSYQNIDIVKRLMRNEQSLYMTDAWIEREGMQNGGVYGAFPMFLEIARDNDFPIAETVSHMTGRTAKRFQLKDRGELSVGNFADITVVDLAGLKSRIDKALPPIGIEHVFINGKHVIKDSEYLENDKPVGMALNI